MCCSPAIAIENIQEQRNNITERPPGTQTWGVWVTSRPKPTAKLCSSRLCSISHCHKWDLFWQYCYDACHCILTTNMFQHKIASWCTVLDDATPQHLAALKVIHHNPKFIFSNSVYIHIYVKCIYIYIYIYVRSGNLSHIWRFLLRLTPKGSLFGHLVLVFYPENCFSTTARPFVLKVIRNIWLCDGSKSSCGQEFHMSSWPRNGQCTKCKILCSYFFQHVLLLLANIKLWFVRCK